MNPSEYDRMLTFGTLVNKLLNIEDKPADG